MSQPVAATEAAPLLDYTLAFDPDPIQAGRPCTLRVTARAGNTPVYVRKTVLTLPIGTGATTLTASPSGIRRLAVTGGDHPHQGEGWRIAAPSGGSFTATPTLARGWLLAVTPLTFGLADIAVNTAPGTAELQIAEDSSLDGSSWQTRTTRLALPKFPANFFFADFRPDTMLVPNGGHAVLSWNGSPAVYTMTWQSHSGGRGGSAVVSDQNPWTSPALHDTTVFRLAASMLGGTAERVLTALVSVARPHLLVHDLTALDTVQMMGTSQPIEVGLGTTHSFTAPTDGILLGRVSANAGGRATGIKVTARAPGTVEYVNDFASDNSDTTKLPAETPFHLPIRRGAQVTAVCRHLDPPSVPESPEPYFSLVWIPDGDAIRTN
ncbi:conserved hypothetical protein [Frankia sp. AiPs1]|uniref:hypothetical protein n=1 Tax=Frankia sp. AiPa1 TaxID=573492 RepID=UPI00202B56CF|nr:hypothetical protein [Frankia sp. AiPa1]MCL9762770.1 hypothetical protein [Frankia sp. AiPa1]